MRYRKATRRIRAAEVRARHRRAEVPPACYRQLVASWRQLPWETRNSRRRSHYRAVEIHIFHKKPFLPPKAISCKISAGNARTNIDMYPETHNKIFEQTTL